MRPLIAAAAFALALAARADAPEPAKVHGVLTVNNQDVPLTHAFALLYDNEENLLDGPELRILLTDHDVPLELLEPAVMTRLSDMARAGDIRGLLLSCEPSKAPQEVHGTVLFPPGSAETSLAFFTETVAGDAKKLTFNQDRVSGALHKEVRKDPFFEDMPVFGFRVSFDLPVAKRDPITARLKDDEARRSPQAEALLTFEQACREGDFDSAKKHATGARIREIDELLKRVGKEELVEQIRQWFPDRDTRRTQIAEVVLRGQRGVVIFEEDGVRQGAPIAESDGQWKVD